MEEEETGVGEERREIKEVWEGIGGLDWGV